jgi:HPt (histidine-containing phosphotransfer) domain-containing protein
MSLDATALARLRELDPDGRHGVLQRVLTAFETSLVRMHAQVSAELPTPDAEVLKSVSHTLKASSAAVGALSLAKCCGDLERGLREGTVADLPFEVRRLLAETEAALGAVGDMLRP